MISIFQVQLAHHSFEVKVNGYPVTSRTKMADIERYLTNFLCRAQVHPDTQLDVESADRFRSNIFFKYAALCYPKECAFFQNRFLAWPFLTRLLIYSPVSQQLLNRLPKDISMLRDFVLSCEDDNDDSFDFPERGEYDISFLLEFHHLPSICIDSFKVKDETVLQDFDITLKMQQSVFDALCSLVRTAKYTFALDVKCGLTVHSEYRWLLN